VINKKRRNYIMLKIEDAALPHLAGMLKESTPLSAIRIMVLGGPSGVGLGLMVDEKAEGDAAITYEKIPFFIDQKLLDYCGTITIGYTEESDGGCVAGNHGAFVITPENKL
jgi:Fe-S cluster assembly iron-binding protein IscA